MRFAVDRLDHLVITCADVEISANWYQRVLGMEREAFGPKNRTALRFGGQKINLHPAGAEIAPHAAHPRPGSADLCFLVEGDVADLSAHLSAAGLAVELGPVPRTGAQGPLTSVYLRDPDGNLVELSVPAAP